jgi:hypothetical protein
MFFNSPTHVYPFVTRAFHNFSNVSTHFIASSRVMVPPKICLAGIYFWFLSSLDAVSSEKLFINLFQSKLASLLSYHLLPLAAYLWCVYPFNTCVPTKEQNSISIRNHIGLVQCYSLNSPTKTHC